MIVKTHLYKNGDECTSITGGFKDWDYGSGGNYTKVNIIKNSDHILMKPNASNKRCTFITNNKINLTKYKNLVFELELVNEKDSNEWGGFGIIADNTKYEYKTTNNTFSSRVVINISSETGEFYIGNHIICGGYAESPFIEYKIKEIYLEEEVQGIDSDVLSEILDFGEVMITNITDLKVRLYDNLKNKEISVSEDDNMTVLVDKVNDVKSYNLPPWFKTSDTWMLAKDMITARELTASCVVGTDIYVLGGKGTGTTGKFKTNECFNTLTNEWTTKADMPSGRERLVVEAVNDKIYAIGGSYLTVNECYDVKSNTWSSKAKLPAMDQGMGSGVIGNVIYTVGGGGTSNSNEKYDTITDTWSSNAAMDDFYNYMCAEVVDGKLYIFVNASTKTICYDPVTDTYTDKASRTNVADFSTCVINNKIYLAGGITNKNESSNMFYDPVTDKWTNKTAVPMGRKLLTVNAVNGIMYVIGGRTISSSSEVVSRNECYLP